MASESATITFLEERSKKNIEDSKVLELFDDIIREWWARSFSRYDNLLTPPQRLALPLVHQGKNVLICSPTGSGKTLSAFMPILNELFVLSKANALENSIYCLYISPLKSLANDIHRNLENPLSEILTIAQERGIKTQPIRHAIRHSDVSSQERGRMLRRTPHILNTTPESLGILLSSPRFRNKLKTVRWVIVDEIQALAGSKRGVHLSISLERLEELKREFMEKDRQFMDPTKGGFIRIGCSATIEPLGDIAAFLAGNNRPIEIVDTRFSRYFDLKLLCPVPDLIFTTSKMLSDKLYEIIHRHIQEHKNTLIFTNTRNGAESMLFNLRARFPEFYNEENSGCHHGSMGKDGRLGTEERLKEGSLKVVCSSTSLELGIDMPFIDLVLQIGSPKSVSALMQRMGRSGHSLDRVIKGRIIVLDQDELVECAVMLERAKAGFIDKVHIPTNCLDALCQHLVGMTLEKTWHLVEVKSVIKRSYCYRHLTDEELMSAVNYLSGKIAGMEKRHIYARIWYDTDTGEIGKRGRNTGMIYYTNTGMIPDQFSCNVFTREGHWVGNLDEKYMEKLDKGDVFVIGGKNYRFCYRRGGNLYAETTIDRPNIPTWASEKLPLSFDLAKNVLQFNRDMLWMMKTQCSDEIIDWLQEQYPIDENSARSISEIFRLQIGYLGEDSLPTDKRIVIEEGLDLKKRRRIYYFLTNYGIRFNDGLSRMVAYLISKEKSTNVCVSITDSGFMVSLPKYMKVDITQIFTSITDENCIQLLEKSIEDTQLLKSIFRINACRSFMILRCYMGQRKSARSQQVSADILINFARKLDKFAILRESCREIIEDRFEAENLTGILQDIRFDEIDIVLKEAASPSLMAFGIAAQGAGDGIFADDKLALLKAFHQNITEMIGLKA